MKCPYCSLSSHTLTFLRRIKSWGLTLKNDWSCQGYGWSRGIFSPKDPHTAVPAFLLCSIFITFRKRTSKQASNYCRPPKTEMFHEWFLPFKVTVLEQFHSPFLWKRQTGYVLKSLLVFLPQRLVLGPFGVGLPGEIWIFQTHALRIRRGYDFEKHADHTDFGSCAVCTDPFELRDPRIPYPIAHGSSYKLCEKRFVLFSEPDLLAGTVLWGVQNPKLRNTWQARDVTRDKPTALAALGYTDIFFLFFSFVLVLEGKKHSAAHA